MSSNNRNGNLPVRLYLEAEKELIRGREDQTLSEKSEEYLLDIMEFLWYQLSDEQREEADNKAAQYNSVYTQQRLIRLPKKSTYFN
jgi:hypothetical protein